jgi:hypothetical protein
MKKYFLILTLATFLFSCEDNLDRIPVDELIDATAYENVDDIAAGVVGVYSGIDYIQQARLNANLTDNTQLGDDNGGQEVATFNLQVDPQINSFPIWSAQYNTANDANRVIEAAAGITVPAEEQGRFDNLLAQLYLIRAAAHLEIMTYYAEDFEDPSSLGIPYQDFVSTVAEPERLTTGEVIELIKQDITTAEGLFNGGFNDIFKANPDYAKFLRTRLALYSGDWAGVITNSNDLIASYPLADQAQYQAMFGGDLDQTEVIFSYDNVVGANFNNIPNNAFRFGGGGNYISMSNELYNILLAEETNNNDVRLSVNFDPASDLDIFNQKGINKYPQGASGFINDVKVARISEVYLMRAEAFARQSQFADAADAVQAVRNARRGSADSSIAYTSLFNAIEDIKFERRLELCYEGHRYVDIKRYRNILNVGMNRDAEDCPGSIPCGLQVSDRRFTFPIPLQELNGNANIVQNPNW